MKKKYFEKPIIEKMQFNLSDKSICSNNKSGLWHDGGGSITGDSTAQATAGVTGRIGGN